MQDEPEGKGMLTMDDQRARGGKANSGTDRKVPKGHGGGSIRDQQAGGGLRLGRATTLPAGILAAGRAARGLLRRYIGKMTGLSRAQITRLVARYLATGRVRIETSRRRRFPQRCCWPGSEF